jgi:polypeptide N-acetylgalactosaminyltransferase
MKIRKRLVIFTIFAFVTIFLFSKFAENSQKNPKNYEKIPKNVKKFEVCRDWHNYKLINDEKNREGFGEHGIAAHLDDPREKLENEKFYNATGISVLISNKISVNRSIPDSRHAECQRVKYPSDLPNVSVIIIFHNEAKSVLLRTVHSVINRTPEELLHEIILVNDKSSNEELYEPLEKYVRENFKGKVKIKNLSERKGLIVTRLEGAKIASGKVLVFFE